MLLPLAADYDVTTPSCWLWCYYPGLLTMMLLPLAAYYDATTPGCWLWCYYPKLLTMMLLPLATDYVVLSSMQHLEQVHLKQLLNVPMISRLRSCCYKFISSMDFFLIFPGLIFVIPEEFCYTFCKILRTQK